MRLSVSANATVLVTQLRRLAGVVNGCAGGGASGSATVDGRFLAKFAFSEPTAVRVWHEARVLKLLADLPAFDVPDVVAAGPDPACLATRIVEGGAPLSYELVRSSLRARVDVLGAELARFLASLNAPQILALARERLGNPLRIPDPGSPAVAM